MSSIVIKVPEDYEGKILINIIPKTKEKIPLLDDESVEEPLKPVQKKSQRKVSSSQKNPKKAREHWKTQPRGPNGCFIPKVSP